MSVITFNMRCSTGRSAAVWPLLSHRRAEDIFGTPVYSGRSKHFSVCKISRMLWDDSFPCSVGTRFISQEQSGRRMNLTIRLHLVLRLRMSGSVPLFPSMSLWRLEIKLVALTVVDLVPLSAILGVPYFRKLPSTGDDLEYNTCSFLVLQRCCVCLCVNSHKWECPDTCIIFLLLYVTLHCVLTKAAGQIHYQTNGQCFIL